VTERGTCLICDGIIVYIQLKWVVGAGAGSRWVLGKLVVLVVVLGMGG
jgi:hypothetical protein